MATNTSPTLEAASRLLLSSRHPLLVCHIAPDGDAVGSLTGLGQALQGMGHAPVMVCSDPLPAALRFIPGAALVAQQAEGPFDLVVALDCSDRERLGNLAQAEGLAGLPLLNVDHHITNLQFGTVNLVDAEASSTAEVVLRLLDYIGAPLSTDVATSLLVGIVSDTRGFRTSNVTVEVFEAALRLMRLGASLPAIAQQALDRRPSSALRLWGAALSGLRVEDRLAWISIPLEMRRAAGYLGNGDAGLVSFLISADEVDLAAVFVEREDGCIEVGLRAVPGFDVAQIALRLGGGGHALAAGCLLPGPLAEAQSRVCTALREELERRRQSHG